MSFKIRIDPRTNTIPVECKNGVLGYSKPDGNGNFVHTPLTKPFVSDFHNMMHGYRTLKKGQQATFDLRPISEEWTDDEHLARVDAGAHAVYITPIASSELAIDRPQEIQSYSLSFTNALKDVFEQFEYAPESSCGQVPIVEFVSDEQSQSFRILKWVERVQHKFGNRIGQFPQRPVVTPAPAPVSQQKPATASFETDPNEMIAKLKARMAASRKGDI